MALRQIPQPQLPTNHYFLPSNTNPTQIPWLSQTINQPYIVLYPQQPPIRDKFYAIPLTTGVLPSLSKSISQPVFSLPPPQPPPVRDKFYAVPLTPGAISALSMTISQPYFIRDDANKYFLTPIPLYTTASAKLFTRLLLGVGF